LICNPSTIRETKLVHRASRHIQKTAQKFEDENAFISSYFNNLQDDIIEYERRTARSHLLFNDSCIDHIANLQRIAKEEQSMREKEDVLVLDTVIETQKLLQQTVSMKIISHEDSHDVIILLCSILCLGFDAFWNES
jgi:hypothetical protein